MKKITDSFKDKKFKYGGYATLMTTVVIVLVVVLNLLVSQLPWSLDLTQNKMYSLSEETQEIVKSVSEPIRIVGLFQIGGENDSFDTIISKYTTLSKNISSTTIDPVKNPTFSNQYTEEGETLDEGSFIVIGESGRYKVIDPYSIVNYSQNQYGQYQADSLALEQQLTSAIKYVTAEELPVVYTLSGHGEEPLVPQLIKELELDNYEIQSLSLLEEGQVPDDCKILIVNAPTSDLNSDEVALIEDYFNRFGRALFMMGFVDEPMPGFDKVFEEYGVEVNQSLIIEGSESNFFQSPTLLVPNYESHAITEPLIKQDLRLTALASQPIEILDLIRDELTIEPLLTTSDNSWTKSDINNITTAEKESNDQEGPFSVALAITDHKEWDSKKGVYYDAKLIVIGNSNFLKTEAYAAEPNYDFVMNGINWLNDQEDSIYIRAKDLSVMPLQMNAMQVYGYAALTIIVIPLLILIAGIIVWRKRRHL